MQIIHLFQSTKKVWLFTLLALFFFSQGGCAEAQGELDEHVILQGTIHIQPVQPIPDDNTGKIQPGTPVKIVVTVENKGSRTSAGGDLYVRYAFAQPLDNHKESLIFQTEKKPLPAIEPGKKVVIQFDTTHKIASLLDFVRHDWSLREYQAMAIVDNHEHLIGTLAITFSAYYYPGMIKELPTKISK